MQVRVFWLGKTRLPGVAELTAEYTRRLSRYCDLTAEAVRAGGRKQKGGSSPEAALLTRSEGLYRIVLDPAGKDLGSQQLAAVIRQIRDGSRQGAAFCVGDADGFSAAFRAKADVLLSLSRMTLPHELARVVLLEQLYRAFSILEGHPYPR